jgi:hypothetical protein
VKLPYEEFDLSGLQSYPLASRPSKVRVADFARPEAARALGDVAAAFPDLLGGADFKAIVTAMRAAHAAGRPIVWGLGAHVIKTGLTPILIDLMSHGFVSALALNGAGVIHDFEIALGGSTSEDVDAALGLGQAVCEYLARTAPPHADVSLLAAAARLGIPVTVHVAIGTDIIHMHPAASGAALGEGSLRDFRYFVSNVAHLAGGVFLNCGSAVILPEVFLKAVALVRNRGLSLEGLTTVNLDFLRHYRPMTNVVNRPTSGVGKGYALVGHHEILIPLLAASLTRA